MADDKTMRGQPDRSKINMDEDYEVKYWAKELGVTRTELQRVVDKVGNAAARSKKISSSSALRRKRQRLSRNLPQMHRSQIDRAWSADRDVSSGPCLLRVISRRF